MKKSKFLAVAALILVAVMLVSCGSRTPSGPKSKFTIAIAGINLDDGVNVTTQMNAEGYNTLAATLLKQKFPNIDI